MIHRSTTPCQIEGCSGYQWARGYCGRHYTELKASGELSTVRPRGTAKERFEGLYLKNPENDCWEWQGSKNRGYGMFWDGKTLVRAIRFAYSMYVGPIPDGHNVLHSCDNPGCVNWESHLFTGTQKMNMQDCSAKGRTAGQLGKVKKKVSPEMAMNIRVMYARGHSLEKLAEIYSLHLTTLNGIVKGLTHLCVS